MNNNNIKFIHMCRGWWLGDKFSVCVCVCNDSCFALLINGNYQVLLRHQAIFSNIACEPPTEVCLSLKLVIQRPVMIVGMREDTVNPPRYGAQSLYWIFLDGHAAWKVLVAVEEWGCSMKRVQSVVQSRTLLWFLVSSTEKYPLFRGSHLGADFGVALLL